MTAKTMKNILLTLALLAGVLPARATEADYKQSAEYQELRDSMHHAFNDGDSVRFFPAVKRLEDYLLSQNDQHAYYTQRCNEIVFQMNRQRIFEAFKMARQLSQELQERKLDNEMYMAYNMLGHLNRYCGNKETAKQLFRKVIDMMEQAGYYESMPPIYMNIVNVEMGDNPDEALQLLDKAAAIAAQYSPERVFDIETRKAVSYFNQGDMARFDEAYKRYREGVSEGRSSVHGRTMEVYHLASQGQTDRAVDMARQEMGEDAGEVVTLVYERAGRWKEAYASLRRETAANDSINNVILSNSLQGYRDELKLYDVERQAARTRTITLSIIIGLLLLLVAALAYIMFSHRRHISQLSKAYEHAMESDKLKSAFIQNMSHEVRTPLNIISGFAQVLANPELSPDTAKRQEMAQLMLKNTRVITTQIEEMLELSFNQATAGAAVRDNNVSVNALLRSVAAESEPFLQQGTRLLVDSQLADDFTFMTNRDMLRRALTALTDNAAKNTLQGTITLQATADDTHLTLAVADTGRGIPTADAERIFERFVKLDSFKAGLGLGLPLCRLIATRLGGTIGLDTDYHDGARFVMTLPR